ncbi:MAG: hypothetical protein AB1656_20060 [Candidatus Omnitrophota bacterium]
MAANPMSHAYSSSIPQSRMSTFALWAIPIAACLLLFLALGLDHEPRQAPIPNSGYSNNAESFSGYGGADNLPAANKNVDLRK